MTFKITTHILPISDRLVFRSILLSSFIFFNLFSSRVDAQGKFKATDLIGDWVVSEKTAVITFFKDGEKFYGMTSWMGKPKNPDGTMRTDVKNPDPSKRSQQLLGALLCKNFVYKGNGVWSDGTIYDSRSGKTYSCKITMKDINTIDLRGYIGISLIGGSATFTRKLTPGPPKPNADKHDKENRH